MDAPNDSLVLRVEDVSISYRSTVDMGINLKETFVRGLSGRKEEKIPAVRGVSFELGHGQVLGIIGSNGAGKSTLLSAISGLLPVDSGAIYASSNPVLLGVGAALRNSISGRRNIRIGLLALGFTDDRLEELVDETIAFSDIGTAIDRPMGTYSSGMRARVNFAIAATISPEILLIDEALAVGDKQFKLKSYNKIESLRDHAGAVIFVSHSMLEVKYICDRVIWLQEGVIRADGPTDEILAEYEAS